MRRYSTEMAIVTANCLLSRPGMPPMNADRHEHGRENQGDGDDRPRDFLHRLERGVPRAMPVLDVMLDRFDHDDRVVDHQSDRQHQSEQRQRVDRKSEQREERRTCR